MTDRRSDDELFRMMRLFRADRRSWSWLGKPTQIRITEIVRAYRFDAGNIDGVACCLEVDELRPLFVASAKTFNFNQRKQLVSLHAHPSLIEDAIAEYFASADFRGAEERFETMIRPFISVFSAHQVNSILKAATENSQIYCARDTRIQLVDLFERTTDLLPDTATSWQSFLAGAIDRYDTHQRIYIELIARMTEAGLWPVSPTAATPPTA